MDVHFAPQEWAPTAVSGVNVGREDLESMIGLVVAETKAIQAHPYDPTVWLRRAHVLRSLGYPELALGDAYKALLLTYRMRKPDLESHASRAGVTSHVWHSAKECVHEEPQVSEQRQQRLDYIYDFMHPNGEYTPQPYPWLHCERRGRSDRVLNLLNADIEGASKPAEPTCKVRRNAFGPGIGAQDGNELWGVFALRAISEGQLVIKDVSRLPAGRSGIKKRSDRLACWTDGDLLWISEKLADKSASMASELRLRARVLQLSQLDGVAHPLDHPLVARLFAHYAPGDKRNLGAFAARIQILNEVLERLGIDVFANLSFDTWVLCTISDRIDTNAWDSGAISGLNTLFSMFNHSCEPNVEWQSDGANSIKMIAKRDVQEGEQLFITYDTYMLSRTVDARRKTLIRWLGDPCMCTRCLREEAAGSFERQPTWDVAEHPALPEESSQS